MANAVEDAVDYVGDGDNWEAIGKTLGGGAMKLIKGDFDSAVDIWGDKDLYFGDTWDEMEWEAEENEERAKEMYD